MTDGQSSTSK